MTSDPVDLQIDGTGLRTLDYASIVADLVLTAPGDRKGQDEDIPNRAGELRVAGLKLAAYDIPPIRMRIDGATRGARYANWFDLQALCLGTALDGLVTLTRVLPNETDDDVDLYDAAGRFNSGLSMGTFNPASGEVSLSFRNSWGSWKRTSDNVYFL